MVQKKKTQACLEKQDSSPFGDTWLQFLEEQTCMNECLDV